MSIKSRLNDFVRRAEERDKRVHHGLRRSSFFHSYFDGYTEIRHLSNNARGYTIERVYTANYYRAEMSDGRFAAVQILYAVIFFLSGVIFGIGAYQTAACNLYWFGALPQALTFLFLGLQFLSLTTLLTSGRNIKRYNYKRGYISFRRFSLLASILAFISAAAALSIEILSGLLSAEFVTPLCFFITSVLLFGINRYDSQVVYAVIPNENAGKMNGQGAFEVNES